MEASLVQPPGGRWAPAGSRQRRQAGVANWPAVRVQAVAGGLGGAADGATDTRHEAVRQQIADARQRLQAAQQRVSRAAASAAAAADGGSAALGRALAATQRPAAASGHGAASAALALVRQEAARADEAVAAVAAAVAGEAHRQQALLSSMQRQLAALSDSVEDGTAAATLHSAPRSSAVCAGASLSAASVSGAGRQLLAATGRVVAAAAVATLASEQQQAHAPAAAAALPARRWDPLGGLPRRGRQRPRLGPLDLLLAPVAPLLRALAAPPSRASQAAAGGNSYDMLLDLLAALSEAPGVQGDSRYDPLRALLQMAPAKGVPRYDFARSVLRGLAAAEPAAGSRSPFDMAADLLQRAGELHPPSGPSRFDPVWPLLHEATLLQEWSGAAPYDPVGSLSDWGPLPAGSVARYDAWKALVAAVQRAEVQESKYEPLRAFLRDFSAPSGAQRYDPAADLRAVAASSWQGPTGASPYCPLAAALDAAAGWAPPTGPSPYCPLSAALEAGPPAKAARWDPLAWLLDGWAAGSSRWEVPEGAAAQRTGAGGGAGVQRADDDGTLTFSFA